MHLRTERVLDGGGNPADAGDPGVLDIPLAVAILIAACYPVVLLPLGFYLPAERRRLRGLFGASV